MNKTGQINKREKIKDQYITGMSFKVGLYRGEICRLLAEKAAFIDTEEKR
ncbi:hypothetical protein HNQ69_001099 [Bartonella callosciuri]|uniref:Uncharacterized protein n=1 Tax=Bartonella callosciuri TaxID=686223 RepID=A0A840NMP1_9HYPH|nr:hypothetical protein [Bartonella callosciuri]MBB5073966.1 hypothetical protein [Bartonella callosciuri]